MGRQRAIMSAYKYPLLYFISINNLVPKAKENGALFHWYLKEIEQKKFTKLLNQITKFYFKKYLEAVATIF